MSNTLRPDPNGYKKRAAETNFPHASRLKVTKEGTFIMENETENGERGGGPIAANLLSMRFEQPHGDKHNDTYSSNAKIVSNGFN